MHRAVAVGLRPFFSYKKVGRAPVGPALINPKFYVSRQYRAKRPRIKLESIRFRGHAHTNPLGFSFTSIMAHKKLERNRQAAPPLQTRRFYIARKCNPFHQKRNRGRTTFVIPPRKSPRLSRCCPSSRMRSYKKLGGTACATPPYKTNWFFCLRLLCLVRTSCQ